MIRGPEHGDLWQDRVWDVWQIWQDQGVVEKLGHQSDRLLDKLTDSYHEPLVGEFRAEVDAGFNWALINSSLDARLEENLYNEYEVEQGEDPIYCIYIGTVFSMMPSGKYYMPFARSNVNAAEAVLDEAYREALEGVLEERGLFEMSGEGDPCDIFFCKVLPRERR